MGWDAMDWKHLSSARTNVSEALGSAKCGEFYC